MTCLNKHPLLLTHIIYTFPLHGVEKWKLNRFSVEMNIFRENFWSRKTDCVCPVLCVYTCFHIIQYSTERLSEPFCILLIPTFWVLKEHYSFSHFHFKNGEGKKTSFLWVIISLRPLETHIIINVQHVKMVGVGFII